MALWLLSQATGTTVALCIATLCCCISFVSGVVFFSLTERSDIVLVSQREKISFCIALSDKVDRRGLTADPAAVTGLNASPFAKEYTLS